MVSFLHRKPSGLGVRAAGAAEGFGGAGDTGQFPRVAGGAVIGAERGRDEGKRALEEAPEVAGPQSVAGPLEGAGVLTGGIRWPTR
jgi:hypothetical protein